MGLRRTIVFSVILLMLIAAPVWAVTTGVSDLPRVTQPVSIDGRLDDDAWRQALQIDLTVETHPGENIPARVKTVAYLMEDGTNLYIAFDARDPDPSKIRAYLRDRDSAYNDDFVGIVIDSYNDERRAFQFFSNPLGSQMDLTNDDVNKQEDDSWDAIWESAGKITDAGYIVEMEIPLSQLRFQKMSGKQTWGVDVVRMYPRESRHRIGSNPLDREINCYLCQFGKIQGLENADPGRDLEIVPTLTAQRTDLRDEPATDPMVNGDVEGEVGLSIRWGITPDLTANLAINPDFSQVESDVAQLDVNNQFALFFPEKRPFFLEGSDYFRTPIQAVFTRTVADPSVGGKITGKRGDNTFGIYAAQDDVTNLMFPGATSSDSETVYIANTAVVGRYSRSFGDASSVGTLFTARDGDGYRNFVGGIDARWKINDQNDVRAQVLRSDTDYPDEVATEFEQPLDAFGGTAAQAEYSYDSRNWFGSARYELRDDGFRADSGFITRVDYDQQAIGAGRRWHGGQNTWWNRLQVKADYHIGHDMDGRLLERETRTEFSINGPKQWYAQAGTITRDVYFDGSLFKENKIHLYTQIKPRGGLFLGLWARVGDQVDFANTRLGKEVRVNPQIEWNLNEHLLARLESSFSRLDSKDGRNIFNAQVHDLRLTWQFSNRSFVRATVQQQNVDRNKAMYVDDIDEETRKTGRQLLYSYKLSPQTVFFLGYSDQLIDDDDLDRLTTTDRIFFMKIGYAWTP